MAKKSHTLLSKLFKKKRIVVISDEEIVTVPLGPRMQAMLAIAFVLSMVWVSYSSGKYFAYQDLITLKDKEILHTNLTNETLQFQVTDMQRNFVRLNTYFEEIQKIKDQTEIQKADGVASAASTEDSSVEATALGDELAQLETEMRHVLYDLHDKVQQRITTLETIVSLTGLNLNQITRHDEDFKRAAAKNAASLQVYQGGAQGGPFIPYDESKNGPAGEAAKETVSAPLFEQSLDSGVEYLVSLEKLVHHMPLVMPMQDAKMTSGFGYRRDPFHKRAAMHSGIDFVGIDNRRILSTAPGRVIRAKRSGAYGLMVEVDHGNGITTRYGHMSKIIVRRGQLVRRGTMLGVQGNTGRSTGSHLHYEVRYHDDALDPNKFLKAGSYVF